MSVAQETPQLVELPIVAEKKTYSRVAIDEGKKDKDGNAEVEYKVLSEDDAKGLVEENERAKAAAEKAGTPYVKTVTIEVTQTFDFDHGNTIDGLKELFNNNEKELCKQTNNAVDIKLGNKVRKLMLAADESGQWTFEPVEGAFSLREYIGEDTATRGKTQLEKAKTILGKLPPDQQAQLIAMLQAMQNGQ